LLNAYQASRRGGLGGKQGLMGSLAPSLMTPSVHHQEEKNDEPNRQ
jgi:hypothetical protein